MIMPLFHIHGLMAGLLAPLSAGGEVSCTAGSMRCKFFAWMGEVAADLVHGRADDAPGDSARAPHNADDRPANRLRLSGRHRRRSRRQ